MRLFPRFFGQSKDLADVVVLRRLEDCVVSAGYWVARMPGEAARLVRRVRVYSLVAAVLCLVTGLLAWPVIGGSSLLTAQVFVSVLSGCAALVIVVPYATGLSDRGDEWIRLCGTYGAVYRELVEVRGRLAAGSLDDLSDVVDIIRRFEGVQERKDALVFAVGEGRLGGVCGVGAVGGGGRWGRAGLGGLRQITGSLLPSVRVRRPGGRSAGVDEEAVLAALVCVLTSGCEPRRVRRFSRVSSFVVSCLFRVRSRGGSGVVSSVGGGGRVRGVGSAGSLTSRAGLGPGTGRGGGDRAGLGPAGGDGRGSAVRLVRDAAGVPLVLGVSAAGAQDAGA
ncbi:hypothetical protein [Streptomyces sp. NPDC048411]|uniref:hypothetical protein n=1 Tax=Streptomyces sp. NPDC048411 TaxID=3157206 RepID=UPI0034530D6A